MNLPEEFFREEKIAGYFVARETKEVWAVNLELLEVFQQFCRQHQLRFWAGFGTLLGAVRHGGFVPWDDDVDILMPREDFARLRTLRQEFAAPYYLQDAAVDTEFWQGGMLKLRRDGTACMQANFFDKSFHQGIGIEIIPVDICAPTEELQQEQFAEVGHWQRMLWAKHHNWERGHWDIAGTEDSVLGRQDYREWRRQAGIFSHEQLENSLLQVCRRYAGSESDKVAIFLSCNARDEYHVFARSDFATLVELNFAGLQLPAPQGYKNILAEFYGEAYMSLPEKKEPHHPAFWSVDESYLVWQKRFLGELQNVAGKVVVLFGTGNMINDYEKKTAGLYPPAFYVDNDRTKWGTRFRGAEVKSPQALLEIPRAKLHVIICNIYFREIGRQLQDMGITEYYIHVEEWNWLFQTPNHIGDPSGLGRRKKYQLGCVVLQGEVLDARAIKQISDAAKQCECLVAAVKHDEAAKAAMLRAVGEIIRVDTAENLTAEELKKKFFYDRIYAI